LIFVDALALQSGGERLTGGSGIPYLSIEVTWRRPLMTAGLVDRQSRVIVEHHGKAALPGDAGRFERTRIVRQNDKCLSFYAVKN
jgi:hypothetical protein